MRQLTGKAQVESGLPGATVGAFSVAALLAVAGVTCLAMAKRRAVTPTIETITWILWAENHGRTTSLF
jgi:hypothetical protein